MRRKPGSRCQLVRKRQLVPKLEAEALPAQNRAGRGNFADMAKPLVSAETWDALRTLSIKGLSDSQLAESFGVTVGAIQSRRFDDAIWAAAKKDQIVKAGRPTLEQQKAREKAAEQVISISGDSLAEIGERNSLLLARYIDKKLKNAVENDLLPELEEWSTAKTASEILRKATGQDRDQAAVSVNLFGGSAGFESSAPTFEAVVETQEGDFC